MERKPTIEDFREFAKALDIPQIKTEKQLFVELLIETFAIDVGNWKHIQGVVVSNEKGASFFKSIKNFERFLRIEVNSMLPPDKYFFIIRPVFNPHVF